MFRLFRRQVGFVLKHTRVLPPSGEQYEVTTNLPLSATKEEFNDVFVKMAYAAQKRMEWINNQEMAAQKRETPDTPLNQDRKSVV